MKALAVFGIMVAFLATIIVVAYAAYQSILELNEKYPEDDEH